MAKEGNLRDIMGHLFVNQTKYKIYRGLNTIGRNKSATVVLCHPNISQQHAILTVVDEEEYYLSEIQSSNGTYIDNVKLKPLVLYRINNNSQIKLADLDAKYVKGIFCVENSQSYLQASQMSMNFNFQETQLIIDASSTSDHQYVNLNADIHEANTQLVSADKEETDNAKADDDDIISDSEVHVGINNNSVDLEKNIGQKQVSSSPGEKRKLASSAANEDEIEEKKSKQDAEKMSEICTEPIEYDFDAFSFNIHDADTQLVNDFDIHEQPTQCIVPETSVQASNNVAGIVDESSNESTDLLQENSEVQSQIEPIKRKPKPIDSDEDSSSNDEIISKKKTKPLTPTRSSNTPNDSGSDTDIEDESLKRKAANFTNQSVGNSFNVSDIIPGAQFDVLMKTLDNNSLPPTQTASFIDSDDDDFVQSSQPQFAATTQEKLSGKKDVTLADNTCESIDNSCADLDDTFIDQQIADSFLEPFSPPGNSNGQQIKNANANSKSIKHIESFSSDDCEQDCSTTIAESTDKQVVVDNEDMSSLPTQKIVADVAVIETNNDVSEDLFTACTQKIETHNLPEVSITKQQTRHNLLSLAKTRKILTIDDENDEQIFTACTQKLPQETESSSRKTAQNDDEIFSLCTQKICTDNANRPDDDKDDDYCIESTQLITDIPKKDDDIFSACTQRLPLQEDEFIFKKPRPVTSEAPVPKQKTEDDSDYLFMQPTQRLTENNQDDPNIDLEPTQIIIEVSKTGNEEEGKNGDLKTASSVESQLEVLFDSQQIQNVPDNRPSNPVASVFQEIDTQTQDLNASKGEEVFIEDKPSPSTSYGDKKVEDNEAKIFVEINLETSRAVTRILEESVKKSVEETVSNKSDKGAEKGANSGRKRATRSSKQKDQKNAETVENRNETEPTKTDEERSSSQNDQNNKKSVSASKVTRQRKTPVKEDAENNVKATPVKRTRYSRITESIEDRDDEVATPSTSARKSTRKKESTSSAVSEGKRRSNRKQTITTLTDEGVDPEKTESNSSRTTRKSKMTPVAPIEEESKAEKGSEETDDDFVIDCTAITKKVNTPVRRTVRINSNASETSISSTQSNKRAKRHKVVFTLLHDPSLEKVVKSLGGSICDEVSASTVLVTENMLRTKKLLEAIGRGIPVCSKTWITDSGSAKTFLDPWDYILADEAAERKLKFKLRESLDRSLAKKLFENYVFQIGPKENKEVLKAVIEACNGKCVSRVPSEKSNFYVVSESKAKTSRANGNTVIKSEAILQSALDQVIHFEKYIL